MKIYTFCLKKGGLNYAIFFWHDCDKTWPKKKYANSNKMGAGDEKGKIQNSSCENDFKVKDLDLDTSK